MEIHGIIPYLGANIGPVDSILQNIKVQCGRLLDPGERDGDVIAVGAQRDASDVQTVGKEQEGLWDNTRPQVTQELQTHGAGAAETLRPMETQMAAAAVVFCAAVGT